MHAQHSWRLAGLILAACSDPSLSVELALPDGTTDVVGVELSILAPSDPDAFDCDGISFGDVEDSVLTAARADQVQLRPASGPAELDAIPRAGTKYLLARALDASGALVAAACAEVGTIHEGHQITLRGEPATLLLLPGLDPGANPTRNVEALITDREGAPLAGIDARYTAYVAGSDPIAASTTSNSEGIALLELDAPPMAGPIAVDLVPRWPRASAATLNAFAPLRVVAEGALTGTVGADSIATDQVVHTGQVGPMGERGFVILGAFEEGTASRRATIGYRNPQSGDYEVSVSEPIDGAVALGMVRRQGSDHAFTISTSTVTEIEPNGSLSTTPSPLAPSLVRQFLPLPDCNGGSPEAVQRVLAVQASGARTVIDQSYAVTSHPIESNLSGAQLLGSGCVAAGDDLELVVATRGPSTVDVVSADGTGSIAAIPISAAFGREIGDSPAALLVNSFTVSGTEIDHYRIQPGGGDLEFELLDVDDTPSVPVSIATGDIDGDERSDTLALVSLGERDGEVEYRLLLALGVPHGDGKLVGVSSAERAIRPRLRLFDFDEDGIEEIVVITPESYTVLSMLRE